jgi:hypothetical protein
LNHTAINLGIPGESDQRAVGIIWSWSSFAGGIPCVTAASIERDHGFDIAAKIGRQAPCLTEQIVELRTFPITLRGRMRSAVLEGKTRLTLESNPSQRASIEQHGKLRSVGLRNRSD